MCTDVLEAVCENSGGTFIGVGPRCDEVSCHSAAPLLSMGALAATVGLLAIVGMWRFRRSGRRDLDDPDQT
jgi:hypothetical protein